MAASPLHAAGRASLTGAAGQRAAANAAPRARALRRGVRRLLRLSCPLLALAAAAPGDAASNKVRISSLTDLAFGTVANLGSDAVQSEDVCLFADTAANGYNVTAVGSGPGGAFQLSSGLAGMPFDVQWSSSAGQSTGAQLDPNVPLSGQVSGATQQTCNNGPASTASLIVVLRSAALSSATAGSYSGTLTLVVGAE